MSLEGKLVDFCVQVNCHRKRRIVWKDSLADDYIHRPDNSEFEVMCSYEMAMKFKKKFLTFKQMNEMEEKMAISDEVVDDDACDDDGKDNDENEIYVDMFSSDIFEFQPGHPGRKCSYLAEFKHEVIPEISLPEGKLFNIEMLHIN